MFELVAQMGGPNEWVHFLREFGSMGILVLGMWWVFKNWLPKEREAHEKALSVQRELFTNTLNMLSDRFSDAQSKVVKSLERCHQNMSEMQAALRSMAEALEKHTTWEEKHLEDQRGLLGELLKTRGD